MRSTIDEARPSLWFTGLRAQMPDFGVYQHPIDIDTCNRSESRITTHIWEENTLTDDPIKANREKNTSSMTP